MTLRVLLMTQWYDPESGSAAQASVTARALARRDVHLEVLTGFPNYPSGKLVDGYRVRPYQREVRDGITVHRAPLWPSHDGRAARRAANYLSWSAGASGVALAKVRRADVVLVHLTPATAALPAMALNAVRGVPYVVHVQDLWPQAVLTSGFLDDQRMQMVERPLNAMCDAIYSRSAAIAATSPGMVPLIAARGISLEKIAVATNWADESVFRPSAPDRELAGQLGITRPFTLMYAGNMGQYQSLDTVLHAAERLRHRHDIGFALVGGGIEEQGLRDRARGMNLDSVVFVPSVPFKKMTSVLALGDVHLVSLLDLPLSRATLPSKLQATMACGKPILGAVTGDPAEVIQRARAGEVVQPGDSAALATAVEAMADAPRGQLVEIGRRAREYYLNEFSEDVSVTRLLGLLRVAAGRWRRSGHE